GPPSVFGVNDAQLRRRSACYQLQVFGCQGKGYGMAREEGARRGIGGKAENAEALRITEQNSLVSYGHVVIASAAKQSLSQYRDCFVVGACPEPSRRNSSQ